MTLLRFPAAEDRAVAELRAMALRLGYAVPAPSPDALAYAEARLEMECRIRQRLAIPGWMLRGEHRAERAPWPPRRG